ncbi:Hypothetical protein, conserved [Brucella abortus str. 2308 A]|uniref:Uncharacterized protein n=1 Tax=Brucella ceti str. Cudo TaxID=595497 RepID=C0G3N0_9HYPH|nr:hypothetical protein BMNI_I0100 [Brucella melitensis NI]EEH15345.1 Hypothetical protein, conserved [Brucella ceti str. Cudo]EEP63621.1 Hypothetical protein, conserved [Brucella abortus str. 2308 A]ERM04049.1 hypothetical protein P408_14645 [Brucella abortus S99]ERM85594.1 hypothetical protein P865_13125 [Brucella abortus 82]KFJ63156.1 hypothetical protein DK59_2949 [Brucella abortus bv. 4 str. 292]
MVFRQRMRKHKQSSLFRQDNLQMVNQIFTGGEVAGGIPAAKIRTR